MNNSKTNPDSANPVIPARLVIGVTGHRKLENRPELAESVRSAIDYIRQISPVLQHTPLHLCVLSPLAEGADRIIAQEILKIPGSVLEVILPFEKHDYLEDFESDNSKKEFEALFSQAESVRTFHPAGSRIEAYAQTGRYVVDQCDILIALWNGKEAEGKGGTQEIIQYALDNKCPVIWINTNNPSEMEIREGRGIDAEPFLNLDSYNSEYVNSNRYDIQLNRNDDFFTAQIKKAKLPLDRLKSTLDYMLRHYVKSDILSLNNQHSYYRAETWVYALALAAVAIAAFQILFIPDRPLILISEIVLMLTVLLIVWFGHRRQWHKKWIDYRFLAERFRSALFMAVANIDVSILRPPRHLSLAYSPKDWKVIAFTSAWRKRPRWDGTEELPFEEVKNFLCEAWIEDQAHYHEDTHERHHRRHRYMTAASYALFGLTIGAALLHVLSVGNELLESVFAFMAVIFPAIAASITAIRTHRDYLRNSMRSAEMVRHLKELKMKIADARNHDEFTALVREAEETMLHESEDWRVVMRFHTIEPV